MDRVQPTPVLPDLFSDFLLQNASASVSDIKKMFGELHAKAISLGLKQHHMSSLRYVTQSKSATWKRQVQLLLKLFACLTSVIVFCFAVWTTEWPVSRNTIASAVWRMKGIEPEEAQIEQCIIPLSQSTMALMRPPIDCGFCAGVSSVDRVTNLSIEEFSAKYAYTGRPVVVMDAASNWSAIKVFSFEFFRDLYGPFSPVTAVSCQFFPFKTEFKNLSQVFQMDEDRSNQRRGAKPWYIGWSNCNSSVANILRQHYDRPYFLSSDSESSNTDWIFMGSPGYGAHMHYDLVTYPSWQAQITGHKLWTLQPPSECFFACPREILVTVHPGEMIVLDTNRWYHSTLIVGADISITIGSEYD
ncbi:hypothetical protein Btru_011342 [Bulinus truncatus]|nr:hypothetical protein Btru_011342 [Bulinus truncatus]